MPGQYARGTLMFKKNSPVVNQLSEYRMYNLSRIVGSIGGRL